MNQIVSVLGPYRSLVDTSNAQEHGSGYVIGDRYTITAGHVLYEYNFSNRRNPDLIGNENILGRRSDVLDYRGYVDLYASEAAIFWINPPAEVDRRENIYLESRPNLIANDSVVFRGGGSVNSSSAGMVLFLNPFDMVRTNNLNIALGSTTTTSEIIRHGLITQIRPGEVVALNSISDTNSGSLEFNVVAQSGDSGGAYLLSYDSRKFIVGTQSSSNQNLDNPRAFGTYFTQSDWAQIIPLILSDQKGNLTTSEPTNLIVGTNSSEAVAGSGRPDILLARAGDDTLSGGDTVWLSNAAISSAATGQIWADDQMFGGLGDDTFTPGMGRDLIHGGDRSNTATDIDNDGLDSISYAGLLSADADKGIKIHIKDTELPASYLTYQLNADFDHAVFVVDQGRDKTVDTLISIERITATGANDILQIDALPSARIGNIAFDTELQVRLGDQRPTDAVRGDHIDMSRATEAMRINWSNTNVMIQLEAAGQSASRLIVFDAEIVTGGRGNDNFNVSASQVEVKGGGGRDNIVVSASGVTIFGDNGNDTIDARQVSGLGFGGANVNYLRGDGFDRISSTYNFDPAALTIGTFETVIGQNYNPTGVGSVNFIDMNMADARLVWNVSLIDQGLDSSGVDTWLYQGELRVVDKTATGLSGVSLGVVIGWTQYLDLATNDTYLQFGVRPNVAFADGFLSLSEGGPNIELVTNFSGGAAQMMAEAAQPDSLSSVSAAAFAGSYGTQSEFRFASEDAFLFQTHNAREFFGAAMEIV